MKNCKIGKYKGFLQKWLCTIPLLFLFLTLLPFSLSSQITVNKKTRILLMLDCSGSMNGFIGGSKVEKMEVAKKLLVRMVDSMRTIENLDIALHTYGDQHREKDCKDSRLAVYFEPENHDRIKKVVKTLEPKGTTPIAYSLTLAQHEFPASRGQNYIILITDGFEECGGDPCAVSRVLQDKGIILKPFIIGIGLGDDVIQSFNCVGRVYNTKTENDLSEILNLVISQALNNTTVQVNLNNSKGEPRETDVNMTFHNSRTNEVVSNYYHTMNSAGRPDTFKLDAVIKYDLHVNTTPPIVKKNIELKSARHNIISVDAAQGNMKINYSKPVRCLVREENSVEVIYVQFGNTTHRYLTGKYDVEALTLPRTCYKGISIADGQLKNIDIPSPGRLEMSYPKDIAGAIFVLNAEKMDWVADIGGDMRGKENYDLQPGSYKITYRIKTSRQTEESVTKEFTITSNNKTSINLN